MVQEKSVAIVHDYLVEAGGAERVVQAFRELFPHAPVYTSVFNKATTLKSLTGADIRTSFLQRLTKSPRLYRLVLPLYPMAFEQFDLSQYGLVLSSSSAFAQGVITQPHTCHICYCYSPARFAWRYQDYVAKEGLGGIWRALLPFLVHYLRIWDYQAAQRVDYFIAISKTVAQRIRKFYGREAAVIYPPIEAERFKINQDIGDYFLIVSRLAPYKRIDLAVEAFNRLGLPLKVVGEGRDLARLKKMARDNVQFLGRVSDLELAGLLSRCQALIFPGEEDFGLTVLEANACGRPAIAYAGGGALETVVEGVTGRLFGEVNADALVRAIKDFNPGDYDVEKTRAHALKFDKEAFKARMVEFIEAKYQEHTGHRKG